MINVPGFLVCLSILFCIADAQAQNHLPEQPRESVALWNNDSLVTQVSDAALQIPDSVAQEPDSIPQQPDSVITDPNNGKEPPVKQETLVIRADTALLGITSDKFFAPSYSFSPSPRKAVIYSAIFPGLGQIYNRQYWKLPIIYGGFVGLTYAITWNNGYYRDYLEAYQHIMDDNPDNDITWHNMLPYGQTAETTDIPWFTGVLQKRKDHYRYYRDLSIICTVGVYLIAIIDAYVDAQLFDFDMSPDLSMRVTPAVIKQERVQGFANSSYGVQLSFNF